MNMNRFFRTLAMVLALLMALSACAVAESLELNGATLQQKAYDDEEHEYDVSLTKSSASIKAAIGDLITVDVGENVEVTKWKTSDKKLATVDEGEVECLKKGTVKITATVKKGSKTAKRVLTIKIYDPFEPKSVKIIAGYDSEDGDDYIFFDAKGKWNVMIGATGEMAGVVLPEDAPQDITWKSSNKNVFKISKAGAYTALKAGKVTVTATASNGKNQTLTVNVKKNQYAANYSKSKLKKLLKEAVDDGSVFVKVKTVEVESPTKVTATFILFNGTKEKISKLKNLDFSIVGGYYEWDDDESDYDYDSDPDFETLVSGQFSSLKVSCAKKSTKEFKLSFTGDMVQNIDVKLSDKNFNVDGEYSFDFK